jgi:hypothetical protein
MEVVGKKSKSSKSEQVVNWKVQKEVVVITDEQYPQSIMIEFTQDKCDLLNLYKKLIALKFL